MIQGDEKIELQDLLLKTNAIHQLSEDNINRMNYIFVEYKIILKYLNEKSPEIFGNIYHYGLAEIKDHKDLIHISLSDALNKQNFIHYKNYLWESITDTLTHISINHPLA